MKQNLRFFMFALLCAVFSTTWGQTTTTYKLTITTDDFNGTSYAANNIEKTSEAVCTTDNTKTYQVTWKSNDVMLSNGKIQFKKTTGYLYNITDLQSITNVIINGAGSSSDFATYYGEEEQPHTITDPHRNFFEVDNKKSGAAYCSSIEITFEITETNDQPTGETYELLSSQYNLVEGDYIIAYSGKAMSNEVVSNKLGYKEPTIDEGNITTDDKTIVWHIAPSETEGYWTIKSLDNNEYVASTNNDNEAITTTTLDDKALWSTSGTYSFTNKATGVGLRYQSYNFYCTTLGAGVFSLYRKHVNVAAPEFTPSGGNFTEEQSVTITCETPGASIYYTTNGTTPTSSSTLYEGAITISETTTLKAIAIIADDESEVAEATYTLIIPSSGYDIDFESEASAYTKWTFDKITSQYTNSGVTAHGGSKYGSTGGAATCSITTKETVATPNSLTCYVSKQTTNTTSSTWYIQVSEDGSTWTDVESTSATDMTKGEWKVFTADLSAYSDVYVRVYYSGSTAIRLIDDLTLSTVAPDKYYVAGDWTNWADNMIEMARNVDGSYTLDNQVVSKNQEFKIIKVASGTTNQVWCGGNADGSSWGINPNSHSHIALNVGGGKNFCMEYAGTWSITVSFDESDSPLLSVDGNWLSYYLVGDFNEWATSDSYKFKKDEETGIYTLSSIIEQEQKFKIIKMIGSEETWYGAISDGNYWVEENKVNEELPMTTPGQNFIMKLSNKNQWKLNYDPDNYKLTLSNYISDVAELPFTFDGGKGDIQDKAGLTNIGIGSDYSSSPTLKFTTTGDALVLHFDERPGTLTFDIKGNPSSGTTITSIFDVLTSEDGETWTTLKTYEDMTNTIQSEGFDNLGENVRYIKWVLTEKKAGNVALGNIILDKYKIFEFSINALATDGTDCYATISALGVGNWKVVGDVEVSTVVVENDVLTYPKVFGNGNLIPGDGAFLVKGAAGDYTFEKSASTEEIDLGDNMLMSTGEGNFFTVAPADAGNTPYLFYKLARNANNDANSVGFYFGADGGAGFTYKKGHQAYLAVPNPTGGTGVQSFSFDGSTGITDMEVVHNNQNEVYTLSGMRVNSKQLTKGLYIVNGKKMVIK